MALDRNPLKQLVSWYEDACKTGLPTPNAMTLATVAKNGRPAARIVLFKGLTEGHLAFFTNYDSRKAEELIGTPFAAAVFHWPSLERQIRIEGAVIKATREESVAYFRTRPRDSQLGAWASAQSQVISGSKELEERMQKLQETYAGKDVPCPPNWGGFHLVPESFEFWIGKPSRLHERFLYQRRADKWDISQLSP